MLLLEFAIALFLFSVLLLLCLCDVRIAFCGDSTVIGRVSEVLHRMICPPWRVVAQLFLDDFAFAATAYLRDYYGIAVAFVTESLLDKAIVECLCCEEILP